MKKIIYRLFIFIFLILLTSILYLSIIGVKTDKFNSEISNQLRKIDKNLEIKLKKVKILLDPLKLEIKAKTIGTDLIYRDKSIQLENIKSNISIKSLVRGNFLLSRMSISTKSLDVKNLISFIRLIRKDPKIYIAEQFVKKGYIISDIEIEFDDSGNIKNNYKLKGFIKDGNIELSKKFDFDKINFTFNIQEKNFTFSDVKLDLNKKSISIPKLKAIKKKDDFLISGKIINKDTTLRKKELDPFIDSDFIVSNVQEINVDSENDFSFILSKKFKIRNLNIDSKINLKKMKLNNFFELKNFFPKIKKFILFKDHKIELNFSKEKLRIIGSGETLFQKEYDKINYEILKRKDEIKYNTNLIITKNLFQIDLLNYEKNKNSELEISVSAEKKINNNFLIRSIFLKEKDNIISIENLRLSNNNKIDDIEKIDINFNDKDKLKNKVQIIKRDKNYLVSGNSFNIDKILEKILDTGKKKEQDLFNYNFRVNFDVNKIFLDNNNIIKNLIGSLYFKDNEISELELESKFLNQKNIKLTIKTNGEEKITTLFSSEAKPLVERYKFIKGFEEGNLDFYSIKKGGKSNSTLKIDNFKIQEIPVLAKLLTLASLQGIADLLTGEGIRFTDFEMKFSSKDELMTIKEIYAIGPAISILMEGYIEKDKLISLRGTLVPATTVNRTISSIPIIGDILVGKKVGEGVFGVSFKIKGPPKNLETSVNPIKTLTPRFITRTLEKVRKN